MTALADTFCPDGWLLKKAKYLFSSLNGATPQSAEPSYWDGEIYWATPEDIGKLSGKTLADTRRKITEEGYKNCGTQLAPVGSIVLTTRAPVGNIAIAGVPLCTNQGCRTLVAKDESINTTFFYYQLLSHKEDLDVLASGTTFKELAADELKAFLVLEPPRDIQNAIVDYLDRETARIDALISAKERLLDLLEEKRRALISHAVTKGLDLNVPMRDSGVPWIGEIPKHWDVKKIKFVAYLKSGENITAELIDEQGDYPVFGGNGLRGYSSSFTHDGDHVLIGRQGALCGNINYTSGKFFASEHAVVASLYGENEVGWFGELLRAMNLRQYSQSAAQPGLSVDEIKALSIPVPPHQEQRSIVEHIRSEIDKIDLLSKATQQTISLLKERRASLIAEAVTGKLADCL